MEASASIIAEAAKKPSHSYSLEVGISVSVALWKGIGCQYTWRFDSIRAALLEVELSTRFVLYTSRMTIILKEEVLLFMADKHGIMDIALKDRMSQEWEYNKRLVLNRKVL